MNEQVQRKNNKYDITFPFDHVNGLVDNKYKNRRYVRESLNRITDMFFKKSRQAGWAPYIRADMHVIDRLSDREFPVSEFFQIIGKIASRCERDILKLAEQKFDYIGNKRFSDGIQPIRINCYGHGAWMLGVSISIHYNPETQSRAFHLDIRTCYAERNMVHRKRVVGVEKIWTRGMPSWMKNPEPYRDPYAIDEEPTEEVTVEEQA